MLTVTRNNLTIEELKFTSRHNNTITIKQVSKNPDELYISKSSGIVISKEDAISFAEALLKFAGQVSNPLKTLKEWEKIRNVKIMDYDGFDRTDPHLFEKLFTRDEFDHGAMHCTCQFSIAELTKLVEREG